VDRKQERQRKHETTKIWPMKHGGVQHNRKVRARSKMEKRIKGGHKYEGARYIYIRGGKVKVKVKITL